MNQKQITKREIEIELCKRSLAYFVRAAWHIVEPGHVYIHGWHIEAICTHLEAATRGEIKNLLINMPPRHAKSLIVSVFWPVWVWLTKPDARWIFASYAESLSKRDSVKCRRIIQSYWFQERFGNVFELTGDQNEKLKFENDKTGYRLATSVDGLGTGEGGDFIVADDPHKVGEAESIKNREGVLDWWDHEMSSRGNDPKKVCKVIIMQRIHQQDLSGHMLDQGGYEHLCLPAEYDGRNKLTKIGWSDPRKLHGELLWPDRFGEPELAEAKLRLGSRQYAGQMQQLPSAQEGDIIKRHWIQRYDRRPEKFDEQILSVDCTFTGKSTSDFVAMGAWGRVGSDKYLLDTVYAQMGITETISALTALCRKWPNTTLKIIENKANGPAVEEMLKHKISGLVLWEPQGDKVSRVHAVSPQFEARNVWFPIGKETDDLIEELCTFPNAVHDDRTDMTSMALIRLEESCSGGVGVMRILR